VIFPAQHLRIVVAIKPVDFRKGHDGLAALVHNEFSKDPFTGTVFVFRSKRADRLKLIFYDGTGLVLVYKRLEDSHFCWPSITNGVMKLSLTQFEALFGGLDWRQIQALEIAPPQCVE